MKQQKNNISMKNIILTVSLLITRFGYGQTNVWADINFYPEVNTDHLQYADSTFSPEFYDIETYNELIIMYINEERRINELPPLVKDEELMKFAQKHSEWMAKTKKYQHSGANIKEVIMHGDDGGCGAYLTHKLDAQTTVGAWMDSPGHRKHLLNPTLTKIGVGYEEGDLGGYSTAVFKR